METYETYIDKVGIGDKSGSPVGFHQITRAKSILYQLLPNQSPLCGCPSIIIRFSSLEGLRSFEHTLP